MKLDQIQEARYVSPTRVKTVTWAITEDGPEPEILVNDDGLTGYFAHCLLAEDGIWQASITDIKEHMGDHHVFEHPEEYDEEYVEQVNQAASQFLEAAKQSAAIYEHGIEYDVGWTALSTTEPSSILNALELYMKSNPEEFGSNIQGALARARTNIKERF
jgi:hypothetical protein